MQNEHGNPEKGKRVLLALTPLGLVAGCGEPDAPTVQVQDSAGVEIVVSPRLRWGEGEGWQVGREALLRIGVVEGDPAYIFSGITGAVRLSDGTVAVADFGAQEVRFFGEGGEHMTTFGRRGGGPGEFTGLSGLGVGTEGGAWAYDFSLRRITWLDGEGELDRMVSLAPLPPALAPVASSRTDPSPSASSGAAT